MAILDAVLSKAAAKAAGYKDPSGKKDETEYPNAKLSEWTPPQEETDVRSTMTKRMALGFTAQYKPRVEFNDLSLVQTTMEDLMAFNTYQPNDGDWPEGDAANSWRSTAIRPVERNKVMSVAGHVAGRLGFLKQTALNDGAVPQEEAADVINSLMEFVRYTYFGPEKLLEMTLASLYAPKAIVYLEYAEVYRPIKTEKIKGKWQYEHRLDEDLSGFLHTVVPPDQLFFENFFERDFQKQSWIIWRRVRTHEQLEAKYCTKKNWEHVQKGMQLVFNDPNSNFYYVYDPELFGEMGEEVIMWHKDEGGAKITMVNGVIVGDCDEKNPREDGLYPFFTLGYQMIRTNFFWDKSLVSCVKQDAKVLNTLYPLIIDGAVLATMPPTIATGSDIIGADVIIPGVTTTLSDKDAKLSPIMEPPDIAKSLLALGEVEKSLDQTVNVQPFSADQMNVTAYQISVMEQQKEEAIGPYRDSLLAASTQMTRLVRGDVLQYFTTVDADKITGDAPLVYKTFLAQKKRIQFEDMSKQTDHLKASYDTLQQQGGMEVDTPLYRVDPKLFRDLKFMMVMSEDVLRPKSENVRFTKNLETFDKAIAAKQAGTNVDMDKMFEDFVLSTNEKSSRNPSRYMMPGGPPLGQDPLQAISGGVSKPQVPLSGPQTPSRPAKPPASRPQPFPAGKLKGAANPVAK